MGSSIQLLFLAVKPWPPVESVKEGGAGVGFLWGEHSRGSFKPPVKLEVNPGSASPASTLRITLDIEAELPFVGAAKNSLDASIRMSQRVKKLPNSGCADSSLGNTIITWPCPGTGVRRCSAG
jgi:hypothetical protein